MATGGGEQPPFRTAHGAPPMTALLPHSFTIGPRQSGLNALRGALSPAVPPLLSAAVRSGGRPLRSMTTSQCRARAPASCHEAIPNASDPRRRCPNRPFCTAHGITQSLPLRVGTGGPAVVVCRWTTATRAAERGTGLQHNVRHRPKSTGPRGYGRGRTLSGRMTRHTPHHTIRRRAPSLHGPADVWQTGPATMDQAGLWAGMHQKGRGLGGGPRGG